MGLEKVYFTMESLGLILKFVLGFLGWMRGLAFRPISKCGVIGGVGGFVGTAAGPGYFLSCLLFLCLSFGTRGELDCLLQIQTSKS